MVTGSRFIAAQPSASRLDRDTFSLRGHPVSSHREFSGERR
jgi:hypothetical protein